jgi:Uma2 family endonuclease
MGSSPVRVLPKKEWTDEELMRLPHEGKAEVVNGELRLMTPAGMEQGEICANLTILLGSYIRRHRLGKVYDAQTGFRPSGGNLRAPDLSFVRLERLPGGRSPKGFGDFPPDLAVEVLAPEEKIEDYEEKVKEYLDWGVRLVWLVDPNTRTVVVCRPDGSRTVVGSEGELSGEEVVPGFSCPLNEVFE